MSIRVPRIASVAGRKVSEPMTDTKTTPIVAIAIDRNSGSSRMNRPAIEIITARPLKNTARPAVLLAMAIPVRRSRPWRHSRRARVTMNSE